MADFERLEVLQLFPSFVWRGQLSPQEYGPLNAGLMRALAGIGAPLDSLKPGENWQSDHALHEAAAFQPLTEWVRAAAASALDYLKVTQQDIAITGCWANVNAPGTPHRLHSHRNNFLSGAYYVQTLDGADSINFFDPRPQAGVIRPPASQLTPENTEMVVLKVGDGTLLLFPAWLQHSVDTNRSSRPRISFSFNLMFTGFAETMARPGWTPGKGRTG
jgi:uncharacterized protein (TIGR02466 family)